MALCQPIDIAIVGAGVAGCTAAIALCPTHKVILIDKQASPPPRVGECLPPAARRILQRLGLLGDFVKQAHLQSQGMQSSWGTDKLYTTDNLANPDGFGWHLDRQAFESYLREVAVQRGAQALWPAQLISSKYVDGLWVLQLDDGRTIAAKWVIDAGGRNSSFVRQQGIGRTALDKQISCWTVMADSQPSRLGLLSACENGWWYSAGIPGNKRVIALQTDPDLIDLKTHKQRSAFLQLAQACPVISHLVGEGEFEPGKNESINVVAANSTRLDQVVGKQWVALGDAALSFDPLSSQGMFNAMAAAMQLAELFIAGQSIERHYELQTQRIWHHYINHRNGFYAQERRWQASPYWQRRHRE
ncbi:MAG: flavin-dependent dehydrogenase [Alteromonadaceae bacterium]|jgi:flavin-dependent dehydrogenase